MKQPNIILKIPDKKTVRVELLMSSIITDSIGEHWIKSILLDTDDEEMLQLMADSVRLVDRLPVFFLYAENKLVRKYYSMLVKEKFNRVKIDLVSYALHKQVNLATGESSHILGEMRRYEPEITIVPNK